MSKTHIINARLFLASIILIYFLLPIMVSAQGLAPAKPPAPKPITQSEWSEKRSTYLTMYNSNSVEKRLKSIDYINTQLYDRLIISNLKYASEVMEFLLQTMAVEGNESVIKAAKDLLAKFLTQSTCITWAVKNHNKIATKESAKLRFIDALSDTAKTSVNDNVLSIAIDLIDKAQPVAVRLAAMNLISRGPSSKSIELMLGLLKDDDINICKGALAVLAGFKPIEKAGDLIKILAEERRADAKTEIVRALETISQQKFGTDIKAWQKWWEDNPLSRVALPAQVETAITKGVNYLLKSATGSTTYDELVFYTLTKSRVKIPEAAMDAMLDRLLNKKLERTYNVALLAMALSDLDANKYIGRITQCAEFLLAGQSTAGNWHYGVTPSKYVNTPSSEPAGPDQGSSTRSVKRLIIKLPRRRAETDYDNSCTQYAILGLRACADAGIEIPAPVWADAEKHLLNTQCSDGGWTYVGNLSGYGSMTAGGLGSLAICKFYLNKEIKNDKNIKRAAEWLAHNFTVRENPKYSSWHYYYLYALERAGIFADTEKFGGNEWYPIGANYLINEQKADGSWGVSALQDSCFAILFLRRATQPLNLKIEITPGGPPGHPAGGPPGHPAGGPAETKPAEEGK